MLLTYITIGNGIHFRNIFRCFYNWKHQNEATHHQFFVLVSQSCVYLSVGYLECCGGHPQLNSESLPLHNRLVMHQLLSEISLLSAFYSCTAAGDDSFSAAFSFCIAVIMFHSTCQRCSVIVQLYIYISSSRFYFCISYLFCRHFVLFSW